MRPHKNNELTIDEYRELFNLPNHIMAIIKSDSTFYKVNEKSNPVLGWEPEEAIGKPVQDFIHPDDWDATLGSMAGLLLGTTSVVTDFVNRARHKNGSWKYISWTAKAKGGMIYCLGTDVTEKMEYEEALGVQSLVLESISEAVTITNNEGTIVFANTAAEKLFGYETEELLGKNFLIISHYERDLAKMYLQDALIELNQNRIWIGEWQNKRKDGSVLTTSCRVTTLDLNGDIHYVCVQRDITEKKKYRQEWQDLQIRFRTFFEQSILPMEIYDLKGNPLEVNHAWEKLFQTTKSQLIGYNILTDPTSSSTGILEYVKRAYAGEAVEVPPFHMKPAEMGREGRPRWLSAWFSPVKNELGEVRELAMILRDVTDERETLAALAQSNAALLNVEERFSLAVKAGNIGIWEWSPGSDKVIWDETTEQIYGYKKGEFPGTTQAYNHHMHEDDRERMWKVVTDAIEKKTSYITDHRIHRLDGSVRWLQGSGMAFYDEEGEPYRVMGTVLDITDRKKAEQEQTLLSHVSEILSSSLEVEENLQRFADLVSQNFCDGVLIDQLNPDGLIQRLIVSHPLKARKDHLSNSPSRSLEEFEDAHPLLASIVSGKTVLIGNLRRPESELAKHYGETFIKEAKNADMSSIITVRLRGRESLLGTMTFFTITGTRRCLDASCISFAEELAYRVSMSFENSLLYMHSQEAIRARDEFLSIASHELKTPLQSLTLQNHMRRRQLEKGQLESLQPEKVLKTLENDNRQLSRINRLIDDMLDITRIRANRLTLHKEKFPFTQFVQEVVERFRSQMEVAGCVVTFLPGREAIILADSYRIEQVVVNLFTNAMKYGAGKPIKIETNSNGKNVTLLVSDEGPGISPGDVERIFDRFERAISSSEVSGLGLGLYISRQIIEQHEGALSVNSEVGVGSTFIMELPVS